jgi:alpha/beta superfamily hydrolase
VLVEGADHFFQDKLPIMRQAISDWLPRHFPALRAEQRA